VSVTRIFWAIFKLQTFSIKRNTTSSVIGQMTTTQAPAVLAASVPSTVLVDVGTLTAYNSA
jgi:hypothetical protein